MILPSAEFLELFKKTAGALSVTEAIAIMNIAELAPSGEYLELGSHKGKSGMAAGHALKKGIFTLVDPIFEDEWTAMGAVGKVKAVSNCAVGYIADYSMNIMPLLTRPLSYVFIDSGVHDDLVMEESKMLEDKIVQGGIIAYHDFLNQFTAVERAFNYMLSTGKFIKIEIDWASIFDYVLDNDLEEGNESWHQYPDLPHPPNFVGALIRL